MARLRLAILLASSTKFKRRVESSPSSCAHSCTVSKPRRYAAITLRLSIPSLQARNTGNLKWHASVLLWEAAYRLIPFSLFSVVFDTMNRRFFKPFYDKKKCLRSQTRNARVKKSARCCRRTASRPVSASGKTFRITNAWHRL